MNRLQIALQVQKVVRALTWADSGLVFARDSVLISLGFTEKVLEEKRLPLAIIRPGAVSIDPDMAERPDLVRIEFAVTLVAANSNDQYGETTLVGANRAGGSDGRGLLEIEEKVQAAIFQVGPAIGLPITFRGATQAQPTLVASLGYIAYGDYRFEALGTVSRTYQSPNGFGGTGGSGQCAMTWNASARWDFRRFILRRASGSTPPATSSSGTGVTLGGSPDGASATSKTDSGLSAGVYSYSLFSVYDDTDSGTDVATSDPQTITVTVS